MFLSFFLIKINIVLTIFHNKYRIIERKNNNYKNITRVFGHTPLSWLTCDVTQELVYDCVLVSWLCGETRAKEELSLLQVVEAGGQIGPRATRQGAHVGDESARRHQLEAARPVPLRVVRSCSLLPSTRLY